MAEAEPSEKPDGLLWRIARLRPGALWILYLALGFFGSLLVDGPFVDIGPVWRAIVSSLFILLWWAYPLFVVVFLSRTFTTDSPKRLTRAIGAFGFLGFWAAVIAVTSTIFLGDSGDLPPAVQLGLDISVVPLFAALFYLLIAASRVLVQAEQGSAYSGNHVVGAFLLFFYLPFFGVFFLQRRIRRLAHDQKNPHSRNRQLPMERMVLVPMKSGHLSLELTEIPNWRSFESYATELLRRLEGRLIRKGKGVDMHIWSVEIESVPLQMVYEDFPNRVCLESDSEPGDMLLRQLRRQLATSASV